MLKRMPCFISATWEEEVEIDDLYKSECVESPWSKNDDSCEYVKTHGGWHGCPYGMHHAEYNPATFDRLYRARVALRDLGEYLHEIAVDKGWWDREHTAGDFIANAHAELSEAWEEYRNGRAVNETYCEGDGKPCGFGVEIADAMIRFMDYCAAKNIDLGALICEKAEYNKKRPYRHGGKVA
jgi:hypothetical protein